MHPRILARALPPYALHTYIGATISARIRMVRETTGTRRCSQCTSTQIVPEALLNAKQTPKFHYTLKAHRAPIAGEVE